MRVAFRVDASILIGTGHVMRCISLAQGLTKRGVDCVFLCRELPGHLAEKIRSCVFDCHLLPADGCSEAASGFSSWLGTTPANDAAATRTILSDLGPDWIVVDQYALGADWERDAVPAGVKILAIDDLANRPHDCDLLLDQNLGRRGEDYVELIPDRCRLLIGPHHALLRSDFASQRAFSLARSRSGQLKNILVTMGGVDKDNATEQVLSILADTPFSLDTKITVVLGSTAPWLRSVQDRAKQMPFATQVLSDVEGMASLLAEADLAIGAGGTSSWERCSVGLPSIVLVLADNQRAPAKSLIDAGVAIFAGDILKAGWQGRLSNALEQVQEPGRLQQLSAAASELVDGHGVDRVAGKMLAHRLSVRHCCRQDARHVWEWRRANGAAQYYQSAKDTPWPEHEDWFDRAMDDSNRLLLMVQQGKVAMAHVRFDREMDRLDTARVSICIDPDWRKLGLAKDCLEAALACAHKNRVNRVVAQVNVRNLASVRLFERAGFEIGDRVGDFQEFTLEFVPKRLPN